MNHTEHEHQKNLMTWAGMVQIPAADDVEPGSTVADYLFAIPLGGRRDAREAARLKAEGAKAGVSDLFLPLQRRGFGGLWIEMKAPGKKPTTLQRDWIARMTRAGYRAECIDDWVGAAQLISEYLGLVSPPPEHAP